jgi:muramoyltetrapeptide carboxypeptidase LdcA involved in peptidoglycan recycling
MQDLIAAFEDSEIRGVITTIGGDDQVTYAKLLPSAPFRKNPKPYFGFSDNTHIMNFLWLNGIPSYYGGALFTQFAMIGGIDPFTKEHLSRALFEEGEYELLPSGFRNDVTINWNDPDSSHAALAFEKNDGWQWDGAGNGEGTTWGGCIESIDEILRHHIEIPSLEEFSKIVLVLESSEELPEASYVHRVIRALGERGCLERVQGVLVGRAKAWDFRDEKSPEERVAYRLAQRETIVSAVRTYNSMAPIVQNLDFGHTNPQIPLPYGKHVRIISSERRVFADF